LSFTWYSIISFFVVSTIVAWLLYRRIFKRNKKLATAEQQESQTLHSQTQAHVYNAVFDTDVVTKDLHES
jgi:ABC-type nickel/cobalt efflux system permease component RcnA